MMEDIYSVMSQVGLDPDTPAIPAADPYPEDEPFDLLGFASRIGEKIANAAGRFMESENRLQQLASIPGGAVQGLLDSFGNTLETTGAIMGQLPTARPVAGVFEALGSGASHVVPDEIVNPVTRATGLMAGEVGQMIYGGKGLGTVASRAPGALSRLGGRGVGADLMRGAVVDLPFGVREETSGALGISDLVSQASDGGVGDFAGMVADVLRESTVARVAAEPLLGLGLGGAIAAGGKVLPALKGLGDAGSVPGSADRGLGAVQPRPRKSEIRALSEKIPEAHYAGNGFTFSLDGTDIGTRAVQENESLYSVSVGISEPVERVTPEVVEDFVTRHIDELRQPGRHIGGWIDTDTGTSHLEVSAVSANRDAMEAFGKHLDEKAIWEQMPDGNGRNVDLRDPGVVTARKDGLSQRELPVEQGAPGRNVSKLAETRSPGQVKAHRAANNYMNNHPHALTVGQEARLLPNRDAVDTEFHSRIANYYENAKSDPSNPEVVAAYRALNQEVAAQFDELRKTGLDITFTDEDPYMTTTDLFADIEQGRMRVFSAPDDHHPLMSRTETEMFRAVHDYFGHYASSSTIAGHGEESAYRVHSLMFSDEAGKALATETRGQNSWVNYFGDHRSKPAAERPFAEQKVFILPSEMRALEYPEAITRDIVGLRTASSGVGVKPESRPMVFAKNRAAVDMLMKPGRVGKKQREEIAQNAIDEWGEASSLDPAKVAKEAGEIYAGLVKRRVSGRLKGMREAFETGARIDGLQWYEGVPEFLSKTLGDAGGLGSGSDVDMFIRILAVTSANKAVGPNVSSTLKAFRQWKLGEEITGVTESQKATLDKLLDLGEFDPATIRDSQLFGKEAPKTNDFYRALWGEDVPVIDLWVTRALLKKDEPTLAEYRWMSALISREAQKAGVSASAYQASMWVGQKALDEGFAAASKGSRRLRDILRQDFKDDIDGLGDLGFADARVVHFLARATAGAMAGSVTGDDLETRLRNALIGAVGVSLGVEFSKRAVKHAKQIGQTGAPVGDVRGDELVDTARGARSIAGKTGEGLAPTPGSLNNSRTVVGKPPLSPIRMADGPERAVVRLKDGTDVTADTHTQAFLDARDQGLDVDGYVPGFYREDGSFVDHMSAMDEVAQQNRELEFTAAEQAHLDELEQSRTVVGRPDNENLDKRTPDFFEKDFDIPETRSRLIDDPNGNARLRETMERLKAEGSLDQQIVTEAATRERTKKLVEELGGDMSQLTKQGRRMNGEEILALREVTRDNTAKLVELETRLARFSKGDLALSSDAVEEIQETVLRLESQNAALFKRIVKESSQFGRQLQQLRYAAEGLKIDDPAFWIRRLAKNMGLDSADAIPPELAEQVERMLRQGRRSEVADLVHKAKTYRWDEKTAMLIKANFLNSPVTHARNLLGTFSHLAFRAAADMPAFLFDRVLSGSMVGLNKATKGKWGRRGFEVTKDPMAHYESATRGIGAIRNKIGLGGEESDFFARIQEADMEKAYQSYAVKTGWHPIADKYIELSFRTLGAEDRFFRAFAHNHSIFEQAMVSAKNAGLKRGTEEFNEYVIDKAITNVPTKWTLEAAAAAEVAVFTNSNTLAKAALEFLRVVKSKPGGHIFAALAAPFVTTPTNILYRTMAATPLNAVNPKMWRAAKKMLKEGDLGAQKEVVEALGQMTAGTGLIAMGMVMALDGRMRGGYPSERTTREQNTFRSSGMQPFSLKLPGGNKWHRVQEIAPIGPLLSLGAVMVEAATNPKHGPVAGEDEIQTVKDAVMKVFRNGGLNANALEAAMASMKSFSEMSALTGTSVALQAVHGDETAGRRLLSSTGRAVSPFGTAGARLARAVDPTTRKVTGASSGFQAAIPGASRNVAPQVDPTTGRTVKMEGGFGERLANQMLNPFNSRSDKRDSDPVIKKLDELGTGIPNLGTPELRGMNQKQKAEFQQRYGQITYKALENLMAAPGFRASSDEDQREQIEKLITKARSQVTEFLRKDGGLFEQTLTGTR